MPKPILTGYEVTITGIASTTPTTVNAPAGMFVAWAFAQDGATDGRIRYDAKVVPSVNGGRIASVTFTMPDSTSTDLVLVCVGQ